jgi:hypothetical protein
VIPDLDYTLTARRDYDPLNGIDVADIIVVRREILQIELLDNPFDFIAADVNLDDSVNVSDIISLRNLILQNQLTLEKSWRFVPTDYTIPSIPRPSLPNFPEERIIIKPLNHTDGQDFTGMKVGDVNRTSDNQRTTGNGLSLALESQEVFPQALISIPVRVKDNYVDIAGWQGTFEFDPEALEFVGIKAANLNIGRTNFGLREVTQGKLNFLYAHSLGLGEGFTPEMVLFNLQFKVKGKPGSQSQVTFGATQTESVAYQSSDLSTRLRIAMREARINVLQFRVKLWPNPAKEFKIEVVRLQAGNTQLKVYNRAGSTVHQQTVATGLGIHLLDLDMRSYPSGIYFLEVTTEEGRIVERLVVN